jgi:hypothetical protein
MDFTLGVVALLAVPLKHNVIRERRGYVPAI